MGTRTEIIIKSLIDELKETIPTLQLKTEYKFYPTRKWKFDYAIPLLKIAIEIEGGVYIRGRHNRVIGFINDMEKYNRATIEGWKVIRYTPQQETDLYNNLKEIIKKHFK